MLKPISQKNLIRKFQKLGFYGPFSGGRHLFMTKGDHKVHIPNAHKGDISKHLLAEILKQADISHDEWDIA